MSSKYHKELMVKATNDNGVEVEIPRRRAVRESVVTNDPDLGRVRLFATKGYILHQDGSIRNVLPKATKAEKKEAKLIRVKLLKERQNEPCR